MKRKAKIFTIPLIAVLFLYPLIFAQETKEESVVEVAPERMPEEIAEKIREKGEMPEMPEELKERRRERIPVPPPIPISPSPTAAPAPAPPSVVIGSGTGLGMTTLLFDPLSIRIQSGQTVDQKIVLSNPRGVGFDELEAFIKFDPEFITVINSDLSVPGINLALSFPKERYPQLRILTNQVDLKKGEIKLRLKCVQGNVYLFGPIAAVRWQAKKKNYSYTISYYFAEEGITTKVQAQGQDILGSPTDPKDGVVSATISIFE